MARKSSIDRLSNDIKTHIERRIAEGRMTLDELIRDLTERYPDDAAEGELPSRSALGRYGKKLTERLAAVKASTEAARLISEEYGDQGDTHSAGILDLIKSEVFESLMAVQDATDPDVSAAERLILLTTAGKNFAALVNSNVRLNKHRDAIAAEAKKELIDAQKQKFSELGKTGVSEETRDAIRQVLGIE